MVEERKRRSIGGGAHDHTANERRQSRNQRIKDAGLVERRILMHPDDADAIRTFAQSLINKRNIVLPTKSDVGEDGRFNYDKQKNK